MDPGAESVIAAPAGVLCVRLLGGFRLSVGDREVTTVDAPRLQSLLAYLVLRRDTPHPRERLAALFWPDSEESQARTNLRQALHLLRRALPDLERYLESETRSVRWRADGPYWLDVAELEGHAARAQRAREDGDAGAERTALEEAIALYADDLLPSCYDDWITRERERLRETFARAAARLTDLLEVERDYRAAIPWARRLLDDDPLNEGACRRLMRLYALSGDRARALRVFHGCATALARELGVEPSAETRAAHEALLEPEAPGAPDAISPAARGTSLVGRGGEYEALQAAWRRAAAGEAVLAVIAGEAGMGKSRLVEELRDWVTRDGVAAAASRCYSAAGGLSYAPVVELLRSPAIAPSLRRLGDPWLGELARLLPELLDERPDLPAPPPLIDDWQRSRLLGALSHAVLAEQRPLLLAVDDLQWCDRETLGWLHYLLRSNPRAPLLVVATARSEELGPKHPAQALLLGARGAGQAVELELEPLVRADTAALASQVSGRDLDEAHAAALFRETEGNPLFVVEWVRAGRADEVVEAADGRGRELPPRAHSVIEARLAQLSAPAQELASLAATVGRAFTFDVLALASARGEEQVIDALDELWQRRIVRERADDSYDFTHDKLRDAAYRSVGSPRRRVLHRRVAQALERLHASDLDGVSAALAAHYERAGSPERAIEFYARAAATAHRVYASQEAITLLSRALELLGARPPSRERDLRELALRTALGVVLVVFKGYGTREVTETYARAWELCEGLGEAPTAPVVRGVGLSCLTRGELRRARELARLLLELGEREGDRMVRVEGHYLLGVTTFWLGELTVARDHLERAISAYVPERARSHLGLYSQDPRIVCLSRLAYTRWHLGDAEEADDLAARALALAEELEHPFSLAYALTFVTWLAIDTHDDRRARELAERLAGLADDHGLGYLQPMGTFLRGWMLVADGRAEDGIAMMHEGLDPYRRSGQLLYMPWSLLLLARLALAAGRADVARAALAETESIAEATGQRVMDPELHRLRGELALAEGAGHADAAPHFARALDVARRHGSEALERRVTASLANAR